MDTLKTNTLFHFTPNFDALKEILSNGFYPLWGWEDLSTLSKDDDEDRIMKISFPKVCFCDVPLSQIKIHTANYGHYGIGLTKEWGFKNGITPINYVNKDNFTNKDFSRVIKKVSKTIFDKLRKKENLDDNFKLLMSLANKFKLFKPYNGDYKDKGDICFYNEREWRYIFEEGTPILLNKKATDHEKKKKEDYMVAENEKLKQKPLEFDASDIKYIITETNEQIISIIRYLEDKVGFKYTANELKILSSKIIAKEQILKDF